MLVALVETAGSLPVVLAALPAGALADIIDRRRLLIVMQVWMVIVATAMGLMALTGHMTTGRLLSGTGASQTRIAGVLMDIRFEAPVAGLR